jgi:hypothetical protein
VTAYRKELEAWLREPMPPDPRERALEEAARALVRGGLEGNLTWAQVEDAMAGLRYDQEPEVEVGDGPRLGLTEEERVRLEARGEADHRMTMELQEAREAEVRELEIDR